jgi:hypothetical protein
MKKKSNKMINKMKKKVKLLVLAYLLF